MSGLASAMPFSISGTNCCGSLTNFFRCPPPRIGRRLGVPAPVASLLPPRTSLAIAIAPASVESAAALARVGRAAALGEQPLGPLGLLPRGWPPRPPALRAPSPACSSRSRLVERRHERVEQRLVAQVRLAALLHPSIAARSAANVVAVGAALPARAMPARRNAVPQIGPEAPPTLLVRASAVFFSRRRRRRTRACPSPRAASRSRGPASSRSRRRRRRRPARRSTSRCRPTVWAIVRTTLLARRASAMSLMHLLGVGAFQAVPGGRRA